MEPKFQTSFIPKKPVAGMGTSYQSLHKPKSAGVSIFMTLAVLLFIVSLAGVGGAYFWKQYLISAQDNYKQTLIAREKQFDLSQIEHLKQVNVQIDTAKQLLRNHLADSQIFQIISTFTIESVRFLSMDLTAPASPSDSLKLTMNGYGSNLSAVAFQSDVLGSLEQYGLRDIVKNPMISNPSLGQSGTVSFGFSASIDPAALSYESLITGTSTPN